MTIVRPTAMDHVFRNDNAYLHILPDPINAIISLPLTMKYLLPILAFSALTTLVCCKENPKDPPPPEPAPVPAPATQEQKGTSVVIGEGGVQVESKDVDVKVTTDTAGVKVNVP